MSWKTQEDATLRKIMGLAGALRLDRVLKTLGFVLQATFSAWVDDNSTKQGAALSFYAVISLAPLLAVAMAMAGMIHGQKHVASEIAHHSGFLGRGSKVIGGVVQGVKGRGLGAGSGIIGIGTVLIGAMGVFVELQDVLNKIWKVKAKSASGFAGQIRKRVLSFVLVVIAVALLVVSVASSAGLTALAKFVSDAIHIPSIFVQPSGAFLTFGITAVVLGAVFKLLPDTRVAWADVWIAAVLTALFFTIGKIIMGAYMSRPSMASAYGAAGSFITLLVWIYYSAQIFLLGAEFTHIYAVEYGSRSRGRLRS
ncbi:MAG: YihY/virulence factor BrkB family protein [Terriglobia bacterium]